MWRCGVLYRGLTDRDTALTEPGLIVYRFDAPLIFANAAYFAERIQELIGAAGDGLRCVVIDAEAISDCDTTAADTLETVDRDLRTRGIELWIARGNSPVLDILRATGLIERLGPDSIFPSVRAAVIAFRERFARHP